MKPRTRISGGGYRRYATACAVVALTIAGTPLYGQSAESDPSIANLPRAGYEPRTIQIGKTIVEPKLDADISYNDNIFATPGDRTGDTVVSVRPRLLAHRQGSNFDMKADAHADLLRYATNSREDVNSFGLNLNTALRHENRSLLISAAFDRTFERRSDPEASVDRARPPALINVASGDVQYRYQGPRIGLQAKLAIAKIDYLPAVDADRDLITYRLSARGSLNVTRRIAVFVEPFVNRRDARLRLDHSGLNRDTTTAGGLAGIAFNLTGKLDGDVGFGVFSAHPDDRRIRSFTGLAASGRVIWHPQTRTAIIAEVFRGDVATSRLGALGRIDTSASVAIDQEARHNLLLHAMVSARDVHYRGVADRDQRYLSCEGEARYLFDRHLALVFNTTYGRREADVSNERFYRWQGTVGVRLIY